MVEARPLRDPIVRGEHAGASPSDAELVQAAAGGEEQAAEQLVHRHWETANRAAFLILGDRHLAEDVAQEAMLKTLGALRSFDGTKPFGPWVYAIAVNGAIDRVRASRVRPPLASEAEQRAIHGFDASGTDLDPNLAAALGTLDPSDRALVVMRYVLDYRAEEIGKELGLTAEGVRTRLHRAMKRLRQAMEEVDG